VILNNFQTSFALVFDMEEYNQPSIENGEALESIPSHDDKDLVLFDGNYHKRKIDLLHSNLYFLYNNNRQKKER
jgi:hypothetical protein